MKKSAFAAALVCLGVGSLVVSTAVAVPPQDLDRAERTTVTLANAVVAAVISISDATPMGSSAADIEANSDAVSLLVPECQTSYKLIDATGDPLDLRNFPQGSFETDALEQLVNGAPIVQEVVGPDLRTYVPLTGDAHPNCATCHTNYVGLAPGTVVGAAAFKVKL